MCVGLREPWQRETHNLLTNDTISIKTTTKRVVVVVASSAQALFFFQIQLAMSRKKAQGTRRPIPMPSFFSEDIPKSPDPSVTLMYPR